MGIIAVLLYQFYVYGKYSIDRDDFGMAAVWPLSLITIIILAPYVLIGKFLIDATWHHDSCLKWVIKHSKDFDLYRGKDAFETLVMAQLWGIRYLIATCQDIDEARDILTNAVHLREGKTTVLLRTKADGVPTPTSAQK